MTEPKPLIEVLKDWPLRVVSYGGGVQSTALLALAAQGKIPHRTFLFANTGDDSEHPDTLRYVREVAMPFAENHGIELVELHKVDRHGKRITLYEDMVKPHRNGLSVPVYLWPSGAPAVRGCTKHWKINVVGEELKRRGANAQYPAHVALGISVDEIQRAKQGTDDRSPWQTRDYPLLDLGMHRNPDCRDAITAAGLPIPPKSACYFCPYTSVAGWRDLRENHQSEWDRTVKVETDLNVRRKATGRNPIFFSKHLVPLPEAVDDQLQLDGLGDDCDSGFCFT